MNQTHPTLEQIIDHLHGELPDVQDAAVHGHIADCPSCAQARDTEMQLTDLLRAHARAQERDLPQGVLAGIRSAVERTPAPSFWERLQAAFRPVVLVPVAAALAAVLYFGLSARHSKAVAAPIDASYYVQNHAALAATTPFSEESAMPALLTSNDTASDEQPVDETH